MFLFSLLIFFIIRFFFFFFFCFFFFFFFFFLYFFFFFFFSSRRRHTRWNCDWSSDVCSSDLNDYDVATITRDRFDVQNLGTDTANVQVSKLEFSSQDAERGEYQHFMLKEIFEQPRTVENALRGRIRSEERRVGKECRSRMSGQ